MPSERHERSIKRLIPLVESMGHHCWVNNCESGKDGYKLPTIITEDGKPCPFIIDLAVRTKEGAMVAFEIFLNHETTKRKKAILQKIGWALVEVNPSDVDYWVKNPSEMEAEMKYQIAQTGKKAPRILTA